MNLKKYLDVLKCPICNSMIDMLSIDSNQYHCASNTDHYWIYIIYDMLDLPKLAVEKVNIYDEKYKYIIVKDFQISEPMCRITISKIDQEKRITYFEKNETIYLPINTFDFKYPISENKMINKIKTILTFQ